MGLPGISIVIPTYGEAPRLEGFLREIVREVGTAGLPFEILVVRDGGADSPLAALPVREIVLPRNLGQNAATLEGVRAARHDWVATFDDDERVRAAGIAPLIAALRGGSDLVYFESPRNSAWPRAFGSRVARAVGVLLGHRIAALGATSTRAFDRSLAVNPETLAQIDRTLTERARRITFVRADGAALSTPSRSRYSAFKLWRHTKLTLGSWSESSVEDDVALVALPEESAHFGVSVAHAEVRDPAVASRLIHQARATRVDLVVARCDGEDVRVVQALERAGFFLTDSLVYFSIDLRRAPAYRAPTDLLIEKPDSESSEAVVELTRKCFRGFFGHYHADPRLPRDRCDELYPRWMRASCRSRDPHSEARVFSIDGRAVAFASARMKAPRHGEALLAGVDPEYQGRGLYSDVVRYGMEWARERGARYFWASTQSSHVVVQRALVKLGFLPRRSVFTLHAWPKDL